MEACLISILQLWKRFPSVDDGFGDEIGTIRYFLTQVRGYRGKAFDELIINALLNIANITQDKAVKIEILDWIEGQVRSPKSIWLAKLLIQLGRNPKANWARSLLRILI